MTKSIHVKLPFCETSIINPGLLACEDYLQYWHLSPVYSGKQLQKGWFPAVTLQVPPFWQKWWQTVWLQFGPVKPSAQLQVGLPVQNK